MTQNLTTQGVLPRGINIEGVTYSRFEMREATLSDMIEAELDSEGASHGIHYNAQLAVRQLISVSNQDGQEFKGPFVVSMVRKRQDFLALREAQIKLDELGNAEANDSGTTGTPSS